MKMFGLQKNIGLQIIAMFIALAAILAMTSDLMASPSGDIQAPPGPIPPSLFDLNILFHPSTNVPWPAVPFYGWRLSHADWSTVEPGKDHYYFDLVDKYVAWGQQHNTEILMTLTYTPQWASSTPNVKTAPGLGVSGQPTDMNDWKKYVRTVAERYKGKIHVYEIWNEPDKKESWTGSVDTMVSMVRDASQILKEVDPSITIVSPPPTGPKGVDFLQQFLAKGGGQYVDVIGYHFYVAENPPEAMAALIQQVKSIMNQNGVGNKPLWNTEAGWYAPKPFPSQELAAGYVARAYVVNWVAGVSRFYWYCWDNHNWTTLELTMPDNTTLRPAGKAFATIQQWMVGASMNKCLTSPNNDWVCELKRSGSSQYIVWNTAGDHNFRLSKDWRVSQYIKLDGTVTKISGEFIPTGVQPVLIQ